MYMRLSFTGSSSTGKTTLALRLKEHPAFSSLTYVTADSRALLEQMGHQSMDRMTREETREFQLRYLQRKLCLESGIENYMTERSTVDVAAYWLVRDAFDLPVRDRDEYIERCKAHACKYDLHIFLPFGLIPFHFDGYRSENLEFHKQIDLQIRAFLSEWRVEHITLDSVDLDSRIEQVLEHVKARL